MPDDTTSASCARAAAEALALSRGLDLASDLLDGGDEHHQIPHPYGVSSSFPLGWWVVLAIPVSPDLLPSSTVIGASKLAGVAQVLGSAGDEG